MSYAEGGRAGARKGADREKRKKPPGRPGTFRPGATGACEAQLWEFTAPPGEDAEGHPQVTHGIAAASLDQAMDFMRREHADFIIIKAELWGIIALLSRSPLD